MTTATEITNQIIRDAHRRLRDYGIERAMTHYAVTKREYRILKDDFEALHGKGKGLVRMSVWTYSGPVQIVEGPW